MIPKQQRAKQHIDEAARLIQEYFSTEPIRLSTKISECGQRNIVYISEIAKCDPFVACVVGDALFNLRSSLDHMMMMIFLRNCNPQALKIEKVYFPIKSGEVEFNKWCKKDDLAQQLPPAILDSLKTLKPYKGGSRSLSTLHELNNIDKHRNLVVSAINYKSMSMLSMLDKESLGNVVESKHRNMMAQMMSSIWINDKNMRQEATVGQEITSYKLGKTPGDPNIKFDFSIIEANVEVRPVIDLLAEIDQEVTSVHNALQSFM